MIDYRWSGGSLVASRVMTSDASHGDGLALYNNTLLAGIPVAPGVLRRGRGVQPRQAP